MANSQPTTKPRGWGLPPKADKYQTRKAWLSFKAANKRTTTIGLLVVLAVILLSIFIAGLAMDPALYASNFANQLLPPSAAHFFGTDYLGHDMFLRTIKGLQLSLVIGLVAAGVSSVIALFLGILSALCGGWVDSTIKWLVDAMMGIPHLVLLLLISYGLGGGVFGVSVAVALTHWPSLTRVIRAEVLSLRTSHYVAASRALGKTSLWIATHHLIPHVLPQFVVGFLLMFPHALIHESALTFLGFGLPLDSPAIGAILSESMKYISVGMWWLALYPGLMLLIVVLLFYALGDNIKLILDPRSAQK
jgi:peptide/nickel transport system permease protein